MDKVIWEKLMNKNKVLLIEYLRENDTNIWQKKKKQQQQRTHKSKNKAGTTSETKEYHSLGKP